MKAPKPMLQDERLTSFENRIHAIELETQRLRDIVTNMPPAYQSEIAAQQEMAGAQIQGLNKNVLIEKLRHAKTLIQAGRFTTAARQLTMILKWIEG